jgi:hypothetical protein
MNRPLFPLRRSWALLLPGLLILAGCMKPVGADANGTPIYPPNNCLIASLCMDVAVNYRPSYGNAAAFAPPYAPVVAPCCQPAPATYSPPSLAQQPETHGRTEVVLTRGGGTFEVPVIINGALQLNFTIDSGAAVVIIPADVMLTLRRTGTLRDADILGKATYTLADGSQTSGLRFRIRSLKVGDRVLQDVEGGSAPITGGMLLGQSFLRRFRSWSMDNARGVLVLQ